MESQSTRYGHVLRLDRGEEVVESLVAFARQRGIRAGGLTGLGAADDIELGFYDPGTRAYTRRRFTGDHEIGALTGNLSLMGGEPFAHCHAVISGRDFVAYTGHLFRAVVSVTCEVQLVTDPGTLERTARPDLGYNPLAPR